MLTIALIVAVIVVIILVINGIAALRYFNSHEYRMEQLSKWSQWPINWPQE